MLFYIHVYLFNYVQEYISCHGSLIPLSQQWGCRKILDARSGNAFNKFYNKSQFGFDFLDPLANFYCENHPMA